MTNKKDNKPKISYLRANEYYDMQNIYDTLYQESLEGKNFKNLMPLITSENNIKVAIRNIKTNTGSMTSGTDELTIKDILNIPEEKAVEKVRKILKNYTPRPVRRKEIPKPNGKTRPLGIPCIWDRLIQQCILQIMQPICEAKFSEKSHGFRPLRSPKTAMAIVYNLINVSKLHYIVEIDIEKFFDNVNHSKLIRQIWSIGIKDKKLINIIKQILKAEIKLPTNNTIIPTKGTPQGGILSPLLANIVLNEFDKWIESQWQENPLTQKYKATERKNGTLGKGHIYRTMRNTTNLKEVFIVRYADDIRLFCRNYNDAIKILKASEEWLKIRLKLTISKEKTRIVNIENKYTEFLGIKIKIDKNTAKDTLKSHICDKAMEKIKHTLIEQIKNIQKPKDGAKIGEEISKLNSIIRGVHNYYDMATRVGEDFSDIAFQVNKVLYNRLKNYGINKKGTIESKSPDGIKYGKSKMIYYLNNQYILPINYIKHRNVKSKIYEANIYTEKGREIIHKSLKIYNLDILKYLANNPVTNMSVMYNDNRVAKFAEQYGRCKVTKIEFISPEQVHCHHITPKSKGGTDEYNNLCLILKDIHILIHAKNNETIKQYLNKFNLDKEAMNRLNSLREKAGEEKINFVE